MNPQNLARAEEAGEQFRKLVLAVLEDRETVDYHGEELPVDVALGIFEWGIRDVIDRRNGKARPASKGSGAA